MLRVFAAKILLIFIYNNDSFHNTAVCARKISDNALITFYLVSLL